MQSPVKVTRDGNLARIEMDDGRGNALGTTMLRALLSAVEEASAADAILLTGRARVFCGGLDLTEVTAMDAPTLGGFLDLFHSTFRALFSVERPMIAAANGSAVAGGAILLCCADLRLGARDNGLVGVNEAQLGIPFPSSALEVVRAALPRHEANRALLFGELVGKEEAYRRGYFHELLQADALMERANAAAKEAAGIPSSASGVVKRAVREEFVTRMDATRASLQETFVKAWTGAEAQSRLKKVMELLKKRG